MKDINAQLDESKKVIEIVSNDMSAITASIEAIEKNIGVILEKLGEDMEGTNATMEDFLMQLLDPSADMESLGELMKEELLDYLDIDEDDILPYEIFSKITLRLALEMAIEKGELESNIAKYGEENGKAASGDGVMDKAAIYQHDIEKADAQIQQIYVNSILEWINQVQTFQDEVEKANEAVDASYLTLFTNMGTGIGTFFSDWGTKISTLKTDSTLANEEVSLVYSTMFTNMGTGISTFFSNWKTEQGNFKTDNETANTELETGYNTLFGTIATNLSTWMTDDVSPFFTAEKWQSLSNGMEVGVSKGWLSVTAWWNENGQLSEISISICDFIGDIKKVWNLLIGWWDKDKKGLSDLKLGIKVPEFKITFDEDDDWAEVFQVFGLAGTPKFTFSFKQYATGGFPEDGWFRASHGEIMGRFDNGQSVVANNMQITEGIARGVRSANSEQNILLREQNVLLRQILAKDSGISTRSIFEAVRTENRNYIHRNGQSAFVY